MVQHHGILFLSVYATYLLQMFCIRRIFKRRHCRLKRPLCQRSRAGIYISFGVIFSTIILLIRSKYYLYHSLYSSARLWHLSIKHPNIIQSTTSLSNLEKLDSTCLYHPNLLKVSLTLLLREFDDIYRSSCILHPPLLVSTLDFYIGSYSVSLAQERLHLTFLDCYPGRECHGSYENILQQQAFPLDLIETYSRKRSDTFKSSPEYDKKRFACIFRWHNRKHISPMYIFKNRMGGSGYCKFSKEIVQAATKSSFSMKILIVRNESDYLHILCRIDSNLFDLNMPSSQRNITVRPFKLSLACAPLTWSQVRKHILLEWIIYHRIVGVEHFLIYIKEDDPLKVQRIVRYLQPFINNHTITLISWQFGKFIETENAFQIPQMIDAIQRTADFSIWIMISDTDEFFYAEHHETLTEILENYQKSAEQNLTLTFRQELSIQNVHMLSSFPPAKSRLVTSRYFSRYKANMHPGRSKIIAYSGSDRFLAAEEVHFFSRDATFVPEQLIRLNHYYNAYNYSRRPIEEIEYMKEDKSLWQRFGLKIRNQFEEYIQR